MAFAVFHSSLFTYPFLFIKTGEKRERKRREKKGKKERKQARKNEQAVIHCFTLQMPTAEAGS